MPWDIEAQYFTTCLLVLCCSKRGRKCIAAAAAAKSHQSCPTRCDPIDGSPPGSSVPGILQAKSWTPLQATVRICVLMGPPGVSYANGSSLLSGSWDEVGWGWTAMCGCPGYTLHRVACLRGQGRARSQLGRHLPSCVPELSVQRGASKNSCQGSV